jgi:hypothetical protein
MNTNPLTQHDDAFADAARIIAALPPAKRQAAEEQLLIGWGATFFREWKEWCSARGL